MTSTAQQQPNCAFCQGNLASLLCKLIRLSLNTAYLIGYRYCHPLKYLELKSFPFHSACYQVLSRALARMDPSDTLSDCHVENIDIEALCSTFEKLHRDWDPRLNLDYGDIGNSVEQYWDAYHGYEALVSNPGDIEELSKYYEHLPQMKFRLPRTFPPQEGVAIHITPSKEYRYTADPFAVFPPEVLLELSTYLPVKSLRAFRSASPAARNTRLTNMFWWKHIIMEMPWLWDIPPSPRNSAESMIDWKQVFEDLSMRSQDHFTQECQENRLERDPRKETILGLVNRRRIWEPCCEIAKLYFELRSTNNSD